MPDESEGQEGAASPWPCQGCCSKCGVGRSCLLAKACKGAGSIQKGVRRSTEEGEGFCIDLGIPRRMYMSPVGLCRSHQEKGKAGGTETSQQLLSECIRDMEARTLWRQFS